MKILYEIREDSIKDEKGGVHTVYGLEVQMQSGEEREIIRTVKDLFCEREDARRLAALCTELELDPDQLDDVIADALALV